MLLSDAKKNQASPSTNIINGINFTFMYHSCIVYTAELYLCQFLIWLFSIKVNNKKTIIVTKENVLTFLIVSGVALELHVTYWDQSISEAWEVKLQKQTLGKSADPWLNESDGNCLIN